MPSDTNDRPRSGRTRKPLATEVATPAEQRRAKLAAALRANLQRRKQRSRALRAQDAVAEKSNRNDSESE